MSRVQGKTERKAAVTTWRKTRPAQAPVGRAGAPSAQSKAETRNTVAVARTPGGGWRSLFGLHRHMAAEALSRLTRTPVASLLTVLVLGVALSLPAALSMTLSHLQQAFGGVATSVRLSLYLEQKVDDARAQKLRRELRSDPAIREVIYISPTQGLADFEKYSGLGKAVGILQDNPLPGVLEVEPRDTAPLAVSNLKNRLLRVGGVDDVRVDDEWLKRLHSLLALGNRIQQGVAALIIGTVLLVVGNTIRLLVVNRRDEIRVIKLVGGSDGYVMLPFLYSGFWYGLAGGVLAWLIMVLLWLLLSGPAEELAILYQSSFRPGFPEAGLSLFLIGGGALMGVTGAVLASWRQIRDIDP